MNQATPAVDDAGRLEALARYAILDTPPEQAFQDLVVIAAAVCGTSIAAVTLVDHERQWIKAAVGMQAGPTRLEDAFCTHAILAPGKTLVVHDVLEDPRLCHNPFVTGAPGVRFYAGAPLVTPEGHALGAVCVLDIRPRTLSSAQLEALEGLARQAVAQMELRRAYAELRHHASERAWYECQLELAQRRLSEENAQLAHASLTDELTGLPNRRAAGVHLGHVIARAGHTGAPFAVAIVDVDFFKAINDRHGHPVGDRVLCEVGQALEARAGGPVFVARLGGEEFVVVMSPMPIDDARATCEAMRAAVSAAGAAHPVTVSVGLVAGEPGDDVAGLYARADLALYRAKQAGRDCVVVLDGG